MSSRKVKLALFALLCLVQLSVPASMIARQERTLARGTSYRFRVAPLDPYDPFRGRYLRLTFPDMTVAVDDEHEFRIDQKVFGVLQADEEGFDRVVRVSPQPPASGDYLRVKITRLGAGQVDVWLPFERYYLAENLAPRAERAYREHVRQNSSDAYVTARVLDGNGVLQELFVAGMPIEKLANR